MTDRKCPHCKKEYNGFKSQKSIDEYRVSLMCQDCQDKIFGKDYDDNNLPVGKCANCGQVSYYKPEICSKKCHIEYMKYLAEDL